MVPVLSTGDQRAFKVAQAIPIERTSMMLLSRRSLLNVATSTAVLAAAPQISSATGSRKTLRLGTRQIEVDGKAATRYRVTQPSGQVGLTLNQGEEFNVKLENGLPVLSGLHWHGMTEPWRQDGVPYLSGPPIAPGADRDFSFPAIVLILFGTDLRTRAACVLVRSPGSHEALRNFLALSCCDWRLLTTAVVMSGNSRSLNVGGGHALLAPDVAYGRIDVLGHHVPHRQTTADNYRLSPNRLDCDASLATTSVIALAMSVAGFTFQAPAKRSLSTPA
jgi:hypothetical protein